MSLSFVEQPVKTALEQKRKNIVQVFSYDGVIKPKKYTEKLDDTIRYIRKYEMDHGHAALIYELDTSELHQLTPRELIAAVNNGQPFDIGPKLQMIVPQLICVELCHNVQDADGTDFSDHFQRVTIQGNALRYDNEYRGKSGAITNSKELDADQLLHSTFLDNSNEMLEPEHIVMSVEHCLVEQAKMMTAGLALRASRMNLSKDLGTGTATFEKIRADRRRAEEIHAILG